MSEEENYTPQRAQRKKGRYGIIRNPSDFSEYDWFRGTLFFVVFALNIAMIILKHYFPEHVAVVSDLINFLSAAGGITALIHLSPAKDKNNERY